MPKLNSTETAPEGDTLPYWEEVFLPPIDDQFMEEVMPDFESLIVIDYDLEREFTERMAADQDYDASEDDDD